MVRIKILIDLDRIPMQYYIPSISNLVTLVHRFEITNKNIMHLSFRWQICNIIFHFSDQLAVIHFCCVHVNVPQARNIFLLVTCLSSLSSESANGNLE